MSIKDYLPIKISILYEKYQDLSACNLHNECPINWPTYSVNYSTVIESFWPIDIAEKTSTGLVQIGLDLDMSIKKDIFPLISEYQVFEYS